MKTGKTGLPQRHGTMTDWRARQKDTTASKPTVTHINCPNCGAHAYVSYAGPWPTAACSHCGTMSWFSDK